MKNILLILGFISIATISIAQTKVGLKLAPAMSFNRVSNEELNYDFKTNGVGARFIFGPTFDYYLGNNYDLHTGILFVPKRVGVTATITTTDSTWSESYKLQYVQIPLALKMYTDEITIDKKLYFVVGGLFDFKFFEQKAKPTNVLVEKFSFMDFSTVLGAGLQTRVGSNTLIETGFSYVRGFVNVTRSRYQNRSFNIKNDLITLDLTIKF